MPLPTPSNGQSKDDFISACMSNSIMNSEFSDNDRRFAVCNSQWDKSKKENSMFTYVYGYEAKEDVDGNLVKGGYIATTHLDSGFLDETRNIWIRDKISKQTLDKWAKEINEGNPRANKVSVNHNRIPHVAGVGIKGSARVDMFPDGEYGLYVDTLVDKTREDFSDIKYRLDNGLLDSFSIEFMTKDLMTGNYIPGAVQETISGNGMIRTLMPASELSGWTLAAQPMNEHAVMIKEVDKLGGKKMENKKEESHSADEQKQSEIVSETVKEVKEVLSDEDKALLKEAKERKKMENKEAEYKEIMKKVKEELKEELNNIVVESKARITSEKEESKEIKNYVESFKNKNSIQLQFKSAAKLAESKGMFNGRDWKSKGTMQGMETKGLGLTTNQNTDTDYLLSAAELSDVFDPVIYNYLNQKTSTFNVLEKDDYSGKGNNQVQFTIKTGKNTTASAYTGNSVTSGNVSRLKLQTKFKKYQVGVEVDGDMIAAARGGPIGDVFAQEVKDSTDDLLEVMNQALYAEVGLESASGVIGFEYITDSAGNTTLYNLTRSATNQLAPDSAGNTYISGSSVDVTIANLRAAIRNAIEEGADLNRLVFFCSPIQYDKIKGLYDDLQRLVPTSSRFGFEGMMSFDSVPVFFDKDCNDDDIFLVDLDTHRIAIWVQPTVEMLGKDGDSEKGFVKTYWCTYNRAPRRMVQIYGNATS